MNFTLIVSWCVTWSLKWINMDNQYISGPKWPFEWESMGTLSWFFQVYSAIFQVRSGLRLGEFKRRRSQETSWPAKRRLISERTSARRDLRRKNWSKTERNQAKSAVHVDRVVMIYIYILNIYIEYMNIEYIYISWISIYINKIKSIEYLFSEKDLERVGNHGHTSADLKT